MRNNRNIVFLAVTILLGYSCQSTLKNSPKEAPRIVNIINFIRQLEPRDSLITEDVLYETVHQQILLLRKHSLPGTFLLQYDALINPRYQTLLKNEISPDSEIGAWWEITQPHVEAAGMKWRGRYPWDWHADVGFTTGYTPQEREKLVDVYMEKYKSIYGKYPSSVGSWFIDAHTLGYMYDKYKIEASCTCKDQIGTDGYTLWGGYWNQGYYPSKINAYMPAQTEEGQIPVPVFRMLGSDPIYQYDMGLETSWQGVASLEPVYPESGGNRAWVEYFFKNMFKEPCLAFNYVQAGQENSFTWEKMKTGLEIQIPILDSLKRQGIIRVETLGESGRWFRKNFPLTPATSVTVTTDVKDEGHQTVWYNSRFYRANLLWKKEAFRIRDIHLFDERMESNYYRNVTTSNQCTFTTLPFIDGFLWSTANEIAGLRLIKNEANGASVELPFNNPKITETENGVLSIEGQTENNKTIRISLSEDEMQMTLEPQDDTLSWALELRTASKVMDQLPFKDISPQTIFANINGFDYKITCPIGSFIKPDALSTFIFQIKPQNHSLTLNFRERL